ncbi:hypothetical protein MKZ38_004823 [Zalerion maritima]|uniref:chitin synthase n=1 Tax=Zalerion maritima TaxID=339359 RepID=A0AAD5RRR4_9PEZI|nr:hypothetical protein MKZ38_004823 [Zalerion maritima]
MSSSSSTGAGGSSFANDTPNLGGIEMVCRSPFSEIDRSKSSAPLVAAFEQEQEIHEGRAAGLNQPEPSPSRNQHPNFVVNVPVPSRIANLVTPRYRDPEAGLRQELTSLDYTSITVDPQHVKVSNGHTLRQRGYLKPRVTEILVGVTVYNENKKLLCRTLHAVIQNIRELCMRQNSKIWGQESWKKVVVCIIADGIEAVDPGVLDVLATLGLYQDGLCRKRSEDGSEIVGHLFEYSTQLSVTEDLVLAEPGLETPPTQLMLLLKPSNCGKLNSYRWLYSAIGGILDPNVVVHIDVGTKLLSPLALYQLWKEFDLEPALGAACGELVCSSHDGNKRQWTNFLNPLFAAQNFEYKVGFQLDRTFESSMGYLSLLPGAFSAYRFVGSAGRPLEDTLIGDPTWVDAHSRDPKALSPLNLNRHLADDRVICFQIIGKRNCIWLLRYFPVKASTDVPMATTDFINQRRRWLNGAFFSNVYVLKRLKDLSQSDHSFLRKTLFYIQPAHNLLSLVLAWFSLAAFLLGTFTINSIAADPPEGTPASGFPFGNATPVVNAVIQIVYLATVLLQFILALGSRPRNHKIGYLISFFIFGIVQIYLMMNIVYLIKRVVDLKWDTNGASNYAYIGEFYADLGQATIVVSAFSVFGVYILSAVLARDGWHLFTSFAQFLFVSSSYVNILNIYAFSNTHDVSWGSKIGNDDLATRHRAAPLGPEVIERRFTFADQDPNIRSAATERCESLSARDREYQDAIQRALTADEPQNEDSQHPKVLATADALMEFRTIILASYIFSNFFVCLIVLNDSLKGLWWLGDSYWHKIWFFRIWLWANSISFLIRFAGSEPFHVERLETAQDLFPLQTNMTGYQWQGRGGRGGSSSKKRKAETSSASTPSSSSYSNNKRPRNDAPRQNTAIYVTGLPVDATVDEVHEVFGRKCGVIAEEIDSGKPRIKLYTDSEGNPKGDALIVFFKPQSVEMAIMLLDDTTLRLGDDGRTMKIEAADSSYKKTQYIEEGGAGSTPGPDEDGDISMNSAANQDKKVRTEKEKQKIRRKAEKLQNKLADWSDDEPYQTEKKQASRWDKTVILKHMFTLKELEEDATAILDIKEDIRDECEKLGEVKNVVLFDLEEEGVVSIKFAEVESADACIRLMDGRSFGGQVVEASIATGTERFKKSKKKADSDSDSDA